MAAATPASVAEGAPAQALVPVHVEVCLVPSSNASPGAVTDSVTGVLEQSQGMVQQGPLDVSGDAALAPHVASVNVDVPEEYASKGVPFYLVDPHVHVFHLDTEGMTHEEAEGEDAVSACAQWTLPSADMVGLWDSLVLEEGVKSRLVHSATTGLLFSSAGVDSSIIAWNRVVLLHGPPGTGKTTLCKALAQKLAVRLNHVFPMAQLLEINAHSLFSKWFSESGKLVQKLFEHITDLLDDPDTLVFVLIDEVESLTAARSASASGSEPSDAVRVVNALLTQIDRLRTRPNVLVLTTSNVTQAIDAAFVDRADIKQYIGLPGPAARYAVLCSCLGELQRVGLATGAGVLPDWEELSPLWEAVKGQLAASAGATSSAEIPPWLSRVTSSDLLTCANSALAAQTGGTPPSTDRAIALLPALWLAAAACAAKGLSGRALRKLPFQAHSFHVQVAGAVGVSTMAAAVCAAALHEQGARADLTRDSSTKMGEGPGAA